jgi:hypothetical protein
MKPVAYAFVAIALLGALFFLFKPADTPSPSTTATLAPGPTATAAAPASTANAILAAPESANHAQDSALAPTLAAVSDVMHIDLVVAHGRLVSGPAVVKAKKNDHLVLSITSDAADELHVHGINLYLKLEPGQRASLDFVASRTGRFTYELHHADLELGALEVYPR